MDNLELETLPLKTFAVRRAWIAFLVGGALLFAAFFWLFNEGLASSLTYNAAGWAAAGAVIVGTRIHKVTYRLPWNLIAAGLGLFMVGDAIYAYGLWSHIAIPWPSWADPLYLAGYPLLIAGVLLLVAARTGRRDRAGFIDSLIVATACGAALWIVTVKPYAADPSLTLLERVVSMGYPLMDLVLVGACGRLVIAMGRRSAAYQMLAGSITLLFVADVLYGIQSLTGTYAGGFTTDGFWIISYILVGAAALHPSMKDLTLPDQSWKPRINSVRMAILSAAFLVLPLILGVQVALGDRPDTVVIIIASVLLTALLFLRMTGLVREIGGQVRLLEDQGGVLRTSLVEREALGAKLHHQAFHDALTGAASRELLSERIDHAAAHRRHESERSAILFVDLDDFKSVNDSFGHGAGDALLCHVVKVLSRCVRPEDTVARVGGDEFAVFLGAADTAVAEVVADRILAALREPVTIQNHTFTVCASIGIAPADNARLDDLLRRSDEAMYHAKHEGKSRHAVFGSFPAREAVVDLTRDLDAALRAGDLEVHYQPIVLLETGEIIGVEALARWTHPTLGPVAPDRFIPAAEEAGLIVDLDVYVLGKATRQMVSWNRRFPATSTMRMSVNISTCSLTRSDLVERVEEILDETGLDGHRLMLEITETAVLTTSEGLVTQLRALKQLGVRLSLDDFGTGYSSFSHLRDLPIDELKIDRSFVTGFPSEGTEDVIAAVTMMGSRLGLLTVAEGIESMEQIRMLREIDCKLGQGYLLGRPAPANALEPAMARGTLSFPQVTATGVEAA